MKKDEKELKTREKWRRTRFEAEHPSLEIGGTQTRNSWRNMTVAWKLEVPELDIFPTRTGISSSAQI